MLKNAQKWSKLITIGFENSSEIMIMILNEIGQILLKDMVQFDQKWSKLIKNDSI